MSTLLYLPFNLLTSSDIRLEDSSLFDPTTKLPLSGSLDYPSVKWQPSFYMKVKMWGLK